MVKKNKKKVEEEFDEYELEKPIEKYKANKRLVISDQGRVLDILDIGTFIKPKFAQCNICPFAPVNGGECNEYVENADCQIERDMFDVIMSTLADNEISDIDKMTVFPFIQSFFRLFRLYSLESNIDMTGIFSDNPIEVKQTISQLKDFFSITKSVEDIYLKFLKELNMTMKERIMNSRRKKEISNQFVEFFAIVDEE